MIPESLRQHEFFGHLSAVVHGSALLVSIRVLGMLAGLALTVFLARTMPTADFGNVMLAMSIALLGGLFATLNIGAGAVRFLASFAAQEDWTSGASYLSFQRSVVLRAFILSWAVIGLLLLATQLGWISGPPGYLLAGIAAAPAFGWLRIHSADVAALGAVVRAAIPNILIRPVLMLCFVAFFYLRGGEISILAVLSAYVVTAYGIAILQHALFRPTLARLQVPPRATEKPDRSLWAGVGLSLLIPTLFLELSVNTVIALASLVLSAEQIAVLGVVLRIQGLVLFGVTSINMVVGPRIAKAHSNDEPRAVSYLLFTSAHLKLWPSLCVVILLALVGEQVLGIFGAEYAAYVRPLLLVALTPIVLAVFGPVVLFVTLLGLQRQANRIFQFAIVLLALLILVLGSLYGIEGVAIAVLIVWLFWHYRLYILIRNNSDYRTLQLWKVGS